MMKKMGRADQRDLDAFYKAGYSKAHVMEVVPGVSLGTIGNFVNLHLIGVKSNRAALGAELMLYQDGLKTMKEVRSGGSFISQSDLRIQFGLGKDKTAQKIVIHWPSGSVNTLRNLPANRFYTVVEGKGVIASLTRGIGLKPLH